MLLFLKEIRNMYDGNLTANPDGLENSFQFARFLSNLSIFYYQIKNI